MKTMQITEEQFEQLLAAFKPKSKASSPTKRRKVQTEPLTIRLPSMLGEPGKEKGKQRESWSGTGGNGQSQAERVHEKWQTPGEGVGE